MGGLGQYARKDIFLVTRKDLGMGGWGLKNPYGVRILNLLEIIGRSLMLMSILNTSQIRNTFIQYNCGFIYPPPDQSKVIHDTFIGNNNNVRNCVIQ